MKRLDRMSSLFWLAFAAYIMVESLRLPLGSLRDPGAGFFPLGSGLILAGLSVVNYLQARRGPDMEERSWYSEERWPNVIMVVAGLVVYTVLLGTLGFLISTFLLMIFLLRAIDPQKWMVTLGGSALGVAMFYVVFKFLLKVQLPKGMWGF